MSVRPLLAIALLAGCRPMTVELEPAALPGFSVALPPYVKVPAQLGYDEGELDGLRDGNRVLVQWSVGPILAPGELRSTFGKALDEAMGGDPPEWDPPRSVTIAGQQASRLDGGVEGVSAVTAVDITCGGRNVVIAVAGLNTRRVRERIFESFACTPIAAEEARLAASAR
ncbi:MAG: hypothetical protein WKG01_14920 [Kofleriaceae bacterium]